MKIKRFTFVIQSVFKKKDHIFGRLETKVFRSGAERTLIYVEKWCELQNTGENPNPKFPNGANRNLSNMNVLALFS
jgi:hypothetical protein